MQLWLYHTDKLDSVVSELTMRRTDHKMRKAPINSDSVQLLSTDSTI